MLVGFIGSPCSGKTTTAAKLFAELKENALPAEYIAEKARSYIANKKFMLRAQGMEHAFSLTDADQLAILNTQFRAELTLNQKSVIVVTDASALNTLMYMSPSLRESTEVDAIAHKAAAMYDLLFISAPVPRPAGDDPNRVHDEAASMHIHQQIEPLLGKYLQNVRTVSLAGPSHARLQTALSETLGRFMSVQ